MKACWCILCTTNPEACKNCLNTQDYNSTSHPNWLPHVPYPNLQPLNFPSGWICPKCGRVLAPNQPFCLWCNQEHKEDTKSN
jgi:hypothetical protein